VCWKEKERHLSIYIYIFLNFKVKKIVAKDPIFVTAFFLCSKKATNTIKSFNAIFRKVFFPQPLQVQNPKILRPAEYGNLLGLKFNFNFFNRISLISKNAEEAFLHGESRVHCYDYSFWPLIWKMVTDESQFHAHFADFWAELAIYCQLCGQYFRQ
jgi:hypothetical protein